MNCRLVKAIRKHAFISHLLSILINNKKGTSVRLPHFLSHLNFIFSREVFKKEIIIVINKRADQQKYRMILKPFMNAFRTAKVH